MEKDKILLVLLYIMFKLTTTTFLHTPCLLGLVDQELALGLNSDIRISTLFCDLIRV